MIEHHSKHFFKSTLVSSLHLATFSIIRVEEASDYVDLKYCTSSYTAGLAYNIHSTLYVRYVSYNLQRRLHTSKRQWRRFVSQQDGDATAIVIRHHRVLSVHRVPSSSLHHLSLSGFFNELPVSYLPGKIEFRNTQARITFTSSNFQKRYTSNNNPSIL